MKQRVLRLRQIIAGLQVDIGKNINYEWVTKEGKELHRDMGTYCMSFFDCEWRMIINNSITYIPYSEEPEYDLTKKFDIEIFILAFKQRNRLDCKLLLTGGITIDIFSMRDVSEPPIYYLTETTTKKVLSVNDIM